MTMTNGKKTCRCLVHIVYPVADYYSIVIIGPGRSSLTWSQTKGIMTCKGMQGNVFCGASSFKRAVGHLYFDLGIFVQWLVFRYSEWHGNEWWLPGAGWEEKQHNASRSQSQHGRGRKLQLNGAQYLMTKTSQLPWKQNASLKQTQIGSVGSGTFFFLRLN